MTEDELIESIKGVWKPTHKVELGQAFGRILEDPERYLIPGGFECGGFSFDREVLDPCLALIDRRGTFEPKGIREYGGCTVVAKADQLIGLDLKEFKTTLSGFDVQKYLDSCQWRFMADIFQPRRMTYHVFCLSEREASGAITLRSIETFRVYPYAKLHEDCCALVEDFRAYVIARGLDGILCARQEAA